MKRQDIGFPEFYAGELLTQSDLPYAVGNFRFESLCFVK